MKKFLMLAIVALMSLGLLTACGGGGGAAREVQVLMGENGAMTFNPATLEAKKGETIKLVAINKDPSQPHSFAVEGIAKAKTKQVPAGKQETITFTVDKAGTFNIICETPGHKDANMVGKLNVTE